MRKTTLKPDQNGEYYRNLGWKRTRTGNRGQHKFLLGTNRKEAEARNVLLERVWQTIEDKQGQHAEWSEVTLDIGTAIAKGTNEVRITRREILSSIPGVGTCFERDMDYARRIGQFRTEFPFINFIPESPEEYHRGVEEGAMLAAVQLEQLERKADRHKQALSQLGKPVSGEMFYAALQDYIEWIKKECHDQSEGHVTDHGMTRIRQVKTIMERLENVPLASLDSYSAIDTLYGYFRKRPLSKRTKKPMKYSSCENYIGELAQFFKWLHLSSKYHWRKPEDFDLIKKKPDELDQDAEAEAEEVPTYSIDQLCIINEYALPLERVLFLLALNCAFGVDQIGRLKIGELRLRDGKLSFIRRVRRKKKVLGMHRLFKQTVDALLWALKRRSKQSPEPTPKDFLLLNDKGHPYWRKTKGGNRGRDIPNMWYRLLDRIQIDHPDFPRYGFNTLRDTSSTMIRDIAGEELSSLHLTHKHQSPDRNLRRYTRGPLRRLFKAQRKLEEKLKRVFDSAPADPFAPRRRTYKGRKVVNEIQRLHGENMPITDIAKTLNVARTTVYRHLEEQQDKQKADSSDK
jgi:hypothetical protein